MKRVAVVTLFALTIVPLVTMPIRAQTQDSGLFDALPTQADIPPGLTVVDEGSRGAAEIAEGFPDPSDAARRLAQWGWQENAYRTFAVPDQLSSEELSSLEVSLHRFADPGGAAAAIPYFSQGRAEMLRLVSSGPQTLMGRVPGGTEITSYDQQGAVLIRITRIGSSPDETWEPSDFQALVRERLAAQRQELYVSPQFEYRFAWDGDRWSSDGESSEPGVYDELNLQSIEGPAYIAVVGMPATLPETGTAEWRGAITKAVFDFADDRAAQYLGASVSFTVDWGTPATIRYTASDGTAWVEAITVAPFVGSDGVVFFVTGIAKELAEQYRPDLTESIDLDLAAAADSASPTPAPWSIDQLPVAGMSPQSLAATLPSSVSGDFATLILQETFRRDPVQGVPEGILYRYGPLGATEPTVTVVVHDGGFHRFESGLRITPEQYVHERANAVLRYWRRSALSVADVSPDAPISFVLGSYASMAHSAAPDKFTLLWTAPGSSWAIEIEAGNERDIRAFIAAWASQVTGTD